MSPPCWRAVLGLVVLAATAADVAHGNTKLQVRGSIESFDQLRGARHAVVLGSKAYVAAPEVDNGGQLVVLDISDLKNPRIEGTVTAPSLAGATYVFQAPLQRKGMTRSSSTLVLVAAEDASALVVVDVTDPAKPIIHAELVDPYHFEGACSVGMVGSHAYVAACKGARMTLVDVSDLANPKVLSFVQLSGVDEVHAVGDYIYLVGGAGKRITVLEDKNGVITKVGSTKDERLQMCQGLYVPAGSKVAYVTSEYKGGTLTAFDISLASKPKVIKSFHAMGKWGMKALHGARDVVVDEYLNIAYVTGSLKDQVSVVSMKDLEGEGFKEVETVTSPMLDKPIGVAKSPDHRTVLAFMPHLGRIATLYQTQKNPEL